MTQADLKILSIIVPVYNDHSNFYETLNSILNFISPASRNALEIVIVDSSEDSSMSREIIRTTVGKKFETKYVWITPSGVYSALNLAINLSSGEYLQCINSGDLLLGCPLNDLHNTTKDVLVYEQDSLVYGQKIRFLASLYSFWPHQSVIYRKNLHLVHGTFSTKFRIISDQLFFLKVRRASNVVFLNHVLTFYKGGGMSDKVSWRNCMEYFYLRRRFGHNILQAVILSFIFPIVKFVVISISPRTFGVLRSMLYRIRNSKSNG